MSRNKQQGHEPPPLSGAVAPRRTLSVGDAMALIVGIVLGAGIFKTPSLVAANAGGEVGVLLIWFLGGVISLCGALCYAELASAYPHPGGEYHYITRAFGRDIAFLFAWARLTVIPTGSIALLSFVFGDYASQIFRLGAQSSSIYAASLVVLLTALNIIGIREGKWTQNLLTALEVIGLIAIIIVGLSFVAPADTTALADAPASSGASLSASWGLALVFVLLTYGGWNEAAYVSAELRGGRRSIMWALLWGILLITCLYVLANLAYLRVLGLDGMVGSEVVAADLMSRAGGQRAAELISVLIAISALTSANATTLMGARTNYALGQDFKLFAPLGRWNERRGAPTNALLIQGAITLALIVLGAMTRRGFETMVDYTAPVFWLFFLLTGVSLFILRKREPETPRPFRVPLYPLTPLLFCAASAYLLYSSVAYTGTGALVGVAVLFAGALVWLIARRKQ